jgi:hypothetical protein
MAVSPTGLPGIAVRGPKNTLWYYFNLRGRWHKSNVLGSKAAYSAPSLVIRAADQATTSNPAGQIDIAVENAHHTLSFYFAGSKGCISAPIRQPVGKVCLRPIADD